MADTTNVTELLAAGAANADIDDLTVCLDIPDALVRVLPPGYQLHVKTLTELEGLRPYPRRVEARTDVTDAFSFLTYFKKFGDAHSEVYGDVRTSTITAILDAPHDAASPRWGQHRVVLGLTHSAAWTAWLGNNARMMPQEVFAEHIEDRSPDLREPDAATMYELAQSLQATKGVNFESGVRLADGQRRFRYAETVEGRAGQRGELAIPTEIKIEVQVWRGIPIVVPMTARFRYRPNAAGLQIAYVLDRVEDVLDAAWLALLEELKGDLPVPVLAGRAPSYA